MEKTLSDTCPGSRLETGCSSAGACTSLWSRSTFMKKDPSADVALAISSAVDPNEEYRSSMEDGHTVLELDAGAEHWTFLGVYDGHGSQQEMSFCKAEMHKIVGKELGKRQASDSMASALKASFLQADSSIQEKYGSLKSGCTATVALARREQSGGVELFVANVGDSRALLVSSSGTRRLTHEHRTSDEPELQRIRDEGGFVYNRRVGGRLSVTRALGDFDLKPIVSAEPDVSSYRGPGDEVVALVLASDGLWDVIDDDEVEELISQSMTEALTIEGFLSMSKRKPHARGVAAATTLEERAAKALVEKAKARGSRDNITVVVAFF